MTAHKDWKEDDRARPPSSSRSVGLWSLLAELERVSEELMAGEGGIEAGRLGELHGKMAEAVQGFQLRGSWSSPLSSQTHEIVTRLLHSGRHVCVTEGRPWGASKPTRYVMPLRFVLRLCSFFVQPNAPRLVRAMIWAARHTHSSANAT
jgi:hypothetical protein